MLGEIKYDWELPPETMRLKRHRLDLPREEALHGCEGECACVCLCVCVRVRVCSRMCAEGSDIARV